MLDPAAGKLHERLGRRLSELLLYEIIDCIPSEKQAATRIAFDIAQAIFDSSTADPRPGQVVPDLTPEQAAVRWLHTLIDGELDVDRCDYILRDGRNYAFEFAAVDLERLVGNLAVAKQADRFVVAVHPHGLSAVEDFMLARYRSYQHSVRHHKVTQFGAALQHCTAAVINNPGKEANSVRQFIKDLETLASASTDEDNHREFEKKYKVPSERTEFLKRFATYDDVWWTSILRNYDEQDQWFELVCARKAGPRTLWKWLGKFAEFGDVASWNERLPGKDEEAGAVWRDEILRLKQEGVIVIRHKFQPWEPDNTGQESKLCVLMRDGKLEPVTKLSRLVKSLRIAWMEELQVHAFAKSRCPLDAKAVYDRLERAMPRAEKKDV